jgi:hypothetical protein
MPLRAATPTAGWRGCGGGAPGADAGQGGPAFRLPRLLDARRHGGGGGRGARRGHALDVTHAVLERIERFDGAVRSYITVDREGARAAAPP